jgi:uncharacterized protein
MIVGIMSDSHDNLPLVECAVEMFNAEGCGLVIHAGDIISPFSIAVLNGLTCPFRAVYGNNDGEKVGLKLKAAALGGSIENPPIMVDADGITIRVLHDCGDWRAEARSSGADVVVFGHTHQVVVEYDGDDNKILGINPGETGGWLSGVSSVALLDTASLEVRIVELGRIK